MDTLPFHPVTRRWFEERFGAPTEVQARVWPLWAAGSHVLATAPTGSGKTLAAFLGALDRLLTGAWAPGGVRVLYLSPLKALNNDIERNLRQPLAELRARFEAEGLPVPTVGVAVRSGDTADDERRRLWSRPPEILITTPESLGILLTQPRSQALFGGLRAVIVDEIHAVLGSKRGTALWTNLERLVPWAGEFQRIGLSATVNPPDLAARVLGGFDASGLPRTVVWAASPGAKAYEVKIVLPARLPEPSESGKVYWESLALELRQGWRDRAFRSSTLIFTNSRRACEKLSRLLNERAPDAPAPTSADLDAYAHHGSLSKELRTEVEGRLQRGELRALVATNSLELGIDVGHLDEVILAETPRTVMSAIQKVGRAGHRAGEVSRARLYPSHGLDLVEAAVVGRCIRGQSVEPMVVPEAPLDVLAQLLLSSLCAQAWTEDDLYALVVRSWPYRALDRRAFDLVIDMLAGRYEGTRIPELKPRIERDEDSDRWKAKSSVPFLLYSSGGTIPDRGYFALRDHRTGSVIGELDEEFVWERTLGDRFALGAQVWKILAIDDQAVRVEPVEAPPHIIPFWIAEDQDRSWFLAEKIGEFLEEADRALAEDPARWTAGLVARDGFSPEAAERLVGTLEDERRVLGALPHRWRLVVEAVVPPPGRGDVRTDADQYVLHTFWGARVNRPWAFALAQAWEDAHGFALETYPGDDQVLVLVPPETDLEEALSLVRPDNLEGLLRRRLEATGYFGARFREGAGRALLLPKAGFDRRMPLWQTRLRSKRLLAAVSGHGDFPILLEAWRQCLHDEFDLEALKDRLTERAAGRIETRVCRTDEPSPFTDGLLWRQVNEAMYAGDEAGPRGSSALDESLWSQLTGPDRPLLDRPLIDDWEARWGRTLEGYAPESPADLADHLEVRVALSEAEWKALVAACARDSGVSVGDWEAAVPVARQGGRVGLRAADLAGPPLGPTLDRWLVGRGPWRLDALAAFWGCAPADLEAWLAAGQAEGTLVVGLLTEGAAARNALSPTGSAPGSSGPTEVCLAATWDQLVRRRRLQRRATATQRPAPEFPEFLARWQGLATPAPAADALERRIGQLIGLPLPAALWEEAVLPARATGFRPADFDRLFLEGGLRWFGAGPRTLLLGFPEDRAAWAAPASPEAEALAERLWGSDPSELAFPDLIARSGLTTAALTPLVWDLAWQGLASATTFAPVRHGLLNDFRFDPGSDHGHPAARGFQRWASARTGAGTWRRWGQSISAPTPLQALEDAKGRARQVLDRYGIVFRALLANEGPAFQWKTLFPALRLMELSGEVVGGPFWDGPWGLQFALPEALRARGEGSEPGTGDRAFWVQHAQDPSSLCGLGLEAFPTLPRRASGTWLWWRGTEHRASLTAQGKKLSLAGPALSPDEVGALVDRSLPLLLPEGQPRWTLETIDGVPAADHALSPAFLEAGFRPHGDKLIAWRNDRKAPVGPRA